MGFFFPIEVVSNLADIADVRLTPEGGTTMLKDWIGLPFLNASSDTAGLRVYQIHLSASYFNRFLLTRW